VHIHWFESVYLLEMQYVIFLNLLLLDEQSNHKSSGPRWQFHQVYTTSKMHGIILVSFILHIDLCTLQQPTDTPMQVLWYEATMQPLMSCSFRRMMVIFIVVCTICLQYTYFMCFYTVSVSLYSAWNINWKYGY